MVPLRILELLEPRLAAGCLDSAPCLHLQRSAISMPVQSLTSYTDGVMHLTLGVKSSFVATVRVCESHFKWEEEYYTGLTTYVYLILECTHSILPARGREVH